MIFFLGDSVNREEIENLEKRNQFIRLIMLFVAVVTLLVFVIYHFFIEDDYSNNVSNIKFHNGAIKDNAPRESLKKYYNKYEV